MRTIVAGLAAVLLAACGPTVDIGNLGGAGARPGDGNAVASGPDGSTRGQPPRSGRNTREGTIAACIADLTRNLPAGTNVPALCECAVDRMIAGTPQMDAVRQCARQQNVALPGQ